MKKFLLNLEFEDIFGGIMFVIVAIILVVAFCCAAKCSNCGNFVSTAFCTKCGVANENYKEPVVENASGLICPVCNVECRTNYCGDCGSGIVFVEDVDAVSGG